MKVEGLLRLLQKFVRVVMKQLKVIEEDGREGERRESLKGF